MNITLYTGPDRSANLRELIQRTPVGSGRFCALVPDPQSAARLERMAASATGGAALGIRVCTFDRLCRLILSQDGAGPALLPAHLRAALIREIIRSRIGTQSPWHAVSSLPGFALAVGQFLEDVRAGRGAASHSAELTAIARAYESHLARMGMTDHEGLILAALDGDAPERFAQSFDGPFLVEGFYDMTPRQFALVQRLAVSFRRAAVAVAVDPARPELFSLADAFADRFRKTGAKERTVTAVPGHPLAHIRAAFTGSTVTPGPVGDADAIEVHTFRSESAEADWIAGTIRELLGRGNVRADDIMVVTRFAAGSAHPLRIAFSRHGVPAAGGAPLKLDSHPLVRCLLDALDAARAPDEDRVTVVQRSGYTFPGGVIDEYTGQDRRAWTSMLAETDTPEGFADSLRRIIVELGIAEAVDAEPDKLLRDRDRAALDMVDGLLDDFSRFYRPVRPMMHAREFVGLFSRLLADAPVVTAGSKSGGVLIAELNHARFVERKLVVLTGLGSESYPAGHDRFSLHAPSIAADIRAHAEAEEPLLFHLAAAGAERLICTFPGLDDEGGGDAAMSPYLRELVALAGPACTAQPHAGVPGAAWEHGAATERGQLESAVRALVRTGADPEQAHEIPEHGTAWKLLKDACSRYRAIRDDTGITLTDPVGREVLRGRWADSEPVAVTALEQYRGCPVAFWYRQVLGLEQETVSPDSLDSRERGILVHEVLAALYREVQAATGSARFTADDLPDVTARMERCVDDAFAEIRHETARLHPLVLQAERQSLKTWLASVLLDEAAYFAQSPFVPAWFEQSFGMHDIAPLEIAGDDKVLRLRGRIDRIDTDGGDPPQVRVVDYKTGAKTAPADIRSGKALQLPLYLDAAHRVLLAGSDIREGCYYHVREAGFDAASGALTGCTGIDGDVDAVIEQARGFALEAYGGMLAGVFPLPAICGRTCEWRAVCRGDRRTQREDGHADI